ncbi:MAG: hypothetical protein E7256_13330 [Lachnospiraceae bacterium]|nr:hypothetical protein [Lachnospiraceae bacterium]
MEYSAVNSLDNLILDITTLYESSLATENELKKAKSDWINVKEAGAKGDGLTDDTTIIRECLRHYNTLFFDSGIYNVTELDIDNKTLLSNHGVTIQTTGLSTNRNAIKLSGSCKIANIDFVQISIQPLLSLINSNNTIITNCTFKVPNDVTFTNGYVDIYSNNKDILFNNCRFEMLIGLSGGIWVRDANKNGITRNIRFKDCYIHHCGRDESIAVWSWFGSVSNVYIDNCNFEMEYNIQRYHCISLGGGDEGLEGEEGNKITGPSYIRNSNISAKSIHCIIKSGDSNGFIENCTINGNNIEYTYAFKKAQLKNCHITNLNGKLCSTGSPTLIDCYISGQNYSIGGSINAYNTIFETSLTNKKSFIEYSGYFFHCTFNVNTGIFINFYSSNKALRFIECIFNVTSSQLKLINVSKGLENISIKIIGSYLPNIPSWVGAKNSGYICGCITESELLIPNIVCTNNTICAWR